MKVNLAGSGRAGPGALCPVPPAGRQVRYRCGTPVQYCTYAPLLRAALLP